GSQTHRRIAFCRPLRGLVSFLCLHPRFADSPGDGVLSPAARAHVFLVPSPPVRGLTGGYSLSPAARAHVFLVPSPPVRGLTGGYSLSPSAGSCGSPGFYPAS